MTDTREGASLVRLERCVLSVTGPQRVKFLHGLLSNDLEALKPGAGRLAALMDARGHLLALMRVLVTPEAVLLELPADRFEVVRALLEHYRVAAPVRFADPGLGVFAVVGRAGSAVLARAGAEVPVEEPQAGVLTQIGGVEARVSRASDLPAHALVVHSSSAHPVWAALLAAGATPCAKESFDALRIEEGRPLFGVDVTEENLLHETGLLREYHSPTKGCYVGQETVARLEARGGHVNKALRGLRLERPVSAGARISVDGHELGRVTTAALSPDLGAIAMGYVHRSHLAPGTAVSVGEIPAVVAGLPLR